MSATLSYDLKKGLSVLTKEHRWDVLTVLILHANIRNRCWVSTDTLTEMATNGNRNKALAAKKWLQAHKVFEIVSYNKRVDDEKKLKPRQHVYQLLGKIQTCEDATCDCQKLKATVHYLYSESIDGHTFESIPVETFKSMDGETRSIPNRSKPKEEKSATALHPLIQAWADARGIDSVNIGAPIHTAKDLTIARRMAKWEVPPTCEEIKQVITNSKAERYRFDWLEADIPKLRLTKPEKKSDVSGRVFQDSSAAASLHGVKIL